MKHSLFAVGALCIIALVGVGIFFLLKSDPEEVHEVLPPEYVTAPNFVLPGTSGKEVVLSEVDADIRIVNFWASWSPYSKTELPALVRIKKEFAEHVEVIALNRDTTPEDGRTFLTSLNLGDDLLFAYDAKDEYFKEVEGFAMPETLFVDRDGNILVHVHGPMTEEVMRAHLTEILY